MNIGFLGVACYPLTLARGVRCAVPLAPRAVAFEACRDGLHHHRFWHATSVASANGRAAHRITRLAPYCLVGELKECAGP